MKAMDSNAPMISVPAGILKQFMANSNPPSPVQISSPLSPLVNGELERNGEVKAKEGSHLVASLKRPNEELGRENMDLKKIRVFKRDENISNPANFGNNVAHLNMQLAHFQSKVNEVTEQPSPDQQSCNILDMDTNTVLQVRPDGTTSNVPQQTEKLESSEVIKTVENPFEVKPDVKRKLRKLPRKELENIILKHFSEKLLHQHELGKAKQLCEKLEITLENNRKKTAQFHKEIEDMRKVTNRLATEHESRKGQTVAPIRIKRSVGIQAAPHIINKGIMQASASIAGIKTLNGSRSSNLPGESNKIMVPSSREQPVSVSPNVTFNTRVMPITTMASINSAPLIPTSQNALLRAIHGAYTTIGTTPGAGTYTSPSNIRGPSQMFMLAPNGMLPLASGQQVVRAPLMQMTLSTPGTTPVNSQMRPILQNGVTNGLQPAVKSGGVIDLTDEDEGVKRAKNAVAISGSAAKSANPSTTTLIMPQSATNLVAVPNSSGGHTVLFSATPVQQTSASMTSNGVSGGTRVVGSGTATISSPVQTTSQMRHPAPLPRTPIQQQSGTTKKLPPQPMLKLSHKDNSIVLSWTMARIEDHEVIASYQLYAYQEGTAAPSPALWKKVGSVKALELPMACTLTQFMPGHIYHFAVRAVDVKARLGPFSDPRSIRLQNS